VAGRRGFGTVIRTTGGRYRARYKTGGVYVNAPDTFGTKREAERWLVQERLRAEADATGGSRPKAKAPTLREFADRWLRDRPLRPSTARTYRVNLERHVYPDLGSIPLDKITPDVVRAWHNRLCPDAPTSRARTYAIVKTILGSAVEEDLIAANPCRIRGASNVRAATEVTTATPEQVAELRDAMPEPYALAVSLGAWCQLRVGETLALRRRDVDTQNGVVRVSRAVTWQHGEPTFGPPKTAAGVRNVHVPPALLPAVVAHLDAHASPGRDGLLFPAEPGGTIPVHLSTFSTQMFKAAVRATDLPETFRYHHLRHTGLTLLAQNGASMAELMARAGHTTVGVALRYSHGTAARDRSLAEGLDVV